MLRSPLPLIRHLLFLTLAISLVGTEAELLLLEHFEDWQQYLPLIILGAAILAQLWYLAAKSRASIRTIQALMLTCIAAGVLGVILHYQGNAEFELEITPTMHGWELFKETMMGATPALAPGAMIQIGLVGLAWAFRHPGLSRGSSAAESQQESSI